MPERIKNEKGEIVKAGCIITNNSNEILLVSTKESKTWSFPKGHLDAGETFEQTAIREVKEETGYTVEIVERLSDITYIKRETDEPIRIAMFQARPLGKHGEAEEKTISEWFSIEKARDVLIPNLIFILDEISL